MGVRTELYESLGPLGGEHAHVRFSTLLRGRRVRWDAHLVTLEHCYREWLRHHGYPDARECRLRQFIEIGPVVSGMTVLTVALHVQSIDRATVQKTIIMIRNYRNLRPGRHEFGESHGFPRTTQGD